MAPRKAKNAWLIQVPLKRDTGTPNLKQYPLRQGTQKGVQLILEKTLKTGLTKHCRSLNNTPSSQSKSQTWTFWVVQWIRIHLPMQGTWVQSLVLEDSTCRGAPKPVSHDYWDSAETTEAREPRACALQQEKSWQWEALALQRKSSSCQLRLEKKAQ